MAIKGILFDKDGTLIDFYEVWGTAAGPVVERLLQHYGLEERDDVRSGIWQALGVTGSGRILADGALAYMTYPQIAAQLYPILRDAGGKRPVEEKKLGLRLQHYFYEEVCKKRTVYPVFTNLQALFGELLQRKICTGIATADSLPSLENCVEKLGIAPYVSFLGASGTTLPEKPDGRLIGHAAAQWHIKPSEIAVVGDTPNDMRFAKNGGAYAIGVLSGTGCRADMECCADAVIGSVDELLSFLDA